MYLALWLIRRWRLPATPCLILPVAVSLKRFLTPLLVLSFGIFVSLLRSGARRYPTATACLRPGHRFFQRSGKRAPIDRTSDSGKLVRVTVRVARPHDALTWMEPASHGLRISVERADPSSQRSHCGGL